MDKSRATFLRKKSIEEGLTLEDMREIVQGLRGDRISACFASKGAKNKKAKIEAENKQHMEEDLFSDLRDVDGARIEDIGNDFDISL